MLQGTSFYPNSIFVDDLGTHLCITCTASHRMQNKPSIVSVPGCCLLLAFRGCSWLLLAAPSCSWLLLAAPVCSWLLLAGCSSVDMQLAGYPFHGTVAFLAISRGLDMVSTGLHAGTTPSPQRLGQKIAIHCGHHKDHRGHSNRLNHRSHSPRMIKTVGFHSPSCGTHSMTRGADLHLASHCRSVSAATVYSSARRPGLYLEVPFGIRSNRSNTNRILPRGS